MPAPLSLDLRRRIQVALEDGGSQRRVAKRFGVSRSTVERLVERVRLTGSLVPKPPAGGPTLLIAEGDRARVLGWVRAEPDLTQEEIARRFDALRRPVSQQTVSRALRRFGITRRKKTMRPEQQLTDEVQAERAAFRAGSAATIRLPTDPNTRRT